MLAFDLLEEILLIMRTLFKSIFTHWCPHVEFTRGGYTKITGIMLGWEANLY